MKVGFIGAGKVGFTLGKYFTENNINLIGYYSRNIESAKEAAEFTKTNYFNSSKEIISNSEIIFITTPDDVIEEVWSSIEKVSIKGKIICHCSGSLSSKIFSNIEIREAFGYSIHPMYAFSDKYNSHKRLKEATITIEGSKEKLEYMVKLFNDLGNKVKVISSENKSLYHIAAVTVSNHVIALVDRGIELLVKCGFSYDEAKDTLFPLMVNNMNNIGDKGIINSLTGPIERCDVDTISKHLEVLSDDDRELYRLLSKRLVKIAKLKNDRDYSKLEKMIGE